MTADSFAASDCAGFVLVLLLVMVYLDTTVRLLIGMGKKLKPVELRLYHSGMQARQGADVFHGAQ